MGEYILWKGEPIKIGTCEDLYYVRFDDLAGMIRAGEAQREGGNLAPREYLSGAFRFRFPFPDEDGDGPGYEARNFDRGLIVPWPAGAVPEGEHERVTVTARPQGGEHGYTISAALPCPLDPAAPADLWRGIMGDRRILQLTQQRPFEGALWAVVRCPYCGQAWRLPPDQGAALAEAIEAENQPREVDRSGESSRAWYREVAARIRAGYARDLAAELAELDAGAGREL